MWFGTHFFFCRRVENWKNCTNFQCACTFRLIQNFIIFSRRFFDVPYDDKSCRNVVALNFIYWVICKCLLHFCWGLVKISIFWATRGNICRCILRSTIASWLWKSWSFQNAYWVFMVHEIIISFMETKSLELLILKKWFQSSLGWTGSRRIFIQHKGGWVIVINKYWRNYWTTFFEIL